MIKNALWSSSILLLSLSFAVKVSASTVVFADTEFNSGNWSTSNSVVTGGATHSQQQLLSGGNPGAYLYMTNTLPGPSHIETINLFLGGNYDPAILGGIASIAYREDQIEFSPPFQGAAIGAAPVLEQDGTIFYGPDLTFTNTSWETITLNGLTAASFLSATSNNPNFTASGKPISFGFLRWNDSTGGATYETYNGLDNWSVTVTTVPTSFVPIPGTLWLFGSGLAGISVIRKRYFKLFQADISRVGWAWPTFLLGGRIKVGRAHPNWLSRWRAGESAPL